MRIENKSAFTLVELIMVMAIIAVVSVFSFGYFGDFSSKQAMNEDLSNLDQTIKNLDTDVKNMKIYDYKITLSTGSLAYISYTNYINQDYKRILDFNNMSLTGILSATGNSMSIGTEFSYILYADDKKYIDNTFDINSKETLNLANFSKTEINSTISGSVVNDIYLNYYSTANSFTGTNDMNKLILTEINTKEDKSDSKLSVLIIENINNKKFIKDQNGHIIDKAFLFFERGGKEISLEIN